MENLEMGAFTEAGWRNWKEMLLGAEAEVGLQEAVTRNLAAGAAILRVMPAGFNLLPMRAPVENSAEVLASPAFSEMLDALEGDYDFILVDSPPLLHCGTVGLLVSLTDTAVLVVESGKTSPSQMARAIAPLNPQGLSGVLLNRTRQ
jgi:Mrp family chromosome partitioning ATPase